jgi:hypothetical protein
MKWIPPFMVVLLAFQLQLVLWQGKHTHTQIHTTKYKRHHIFLLLFHNKHSCYHLRWIGFLCWCWDWRCFALLFLDIVDWISWRVIAPITGGLLVQHLGAHTPGYVCSGICLYLIYLALVLRKYKTNEKIMSTINGNINSSKKRKHQTIINVVVSTLFQIVSLSSSIQSNHSDFFLFDRNHWIL